MARITWSTVGTRFYEAGVDRGVLYVDEFAGVPWIGLIAVDENPSAGERREYFIDGEKYLSLSSKEDFEATIRAYTYPVEFSQCDGTAQVRTGLFFSQQRRKPFGFSYRTLVGNEVDGTEHGYKLHLVYNALATPTSRSASSFSDSIEPSDFSWNISTKPLMVSGHASTAHVVVDSRHTNETIMAVIEDILYGSDTEVSRLPTPAELIEIFDTPLAYSVTDNGNGTFLVAGPNENVSSLGDGIYTINHPTVTIIDEDTFTLTY